MLENITPLIITFNESPNIKRTLEKLLWAKEIIVIDSYSTDDTLEILHSYPQVKVFKNKFESFAFQCNYGLEQISSEWVLSIDADYILSNELISEIRGLSPSSSINSYIVKFKYCVFGKPLRATLLPPRKVLYRLKNSIYKEDGHAHRVDVEGNSAILSNYIYHDDRKSLTRWLLAQDRYMVIESKKLLQTPKSELSLSDRIRKYKILAPFLILVYCLIFQGLIFDGWPGIYYILQRVLAEILLSINLIEQEMKIMLLKANNQ